MAEATDRPQTSGQAPPDAVMTGEQFSALAPATAETYQPLSLLALAGFGIAVLYVAIVLIGAAVSLFSRVPWLMPYWTFLIPIAALIVCGAARSRIRSSEGTLSGLAFTTWGSRLAILVGILYATYYASTFFVVRLQAIKATDDFFAQLKQRNLHRAFLMSKGTPPKGISDSELRNEVEMRYNQPKGRPGSVGAFTRFREDLFVRFIEMDGDNANIFPRGVIEWEYKDNSYRVILNYHIETSLVGFDARVEAFGRDPRPGEPKGRQWQVNLVGATATTIPKSMRLTEVGEAFGEKTKKAVTFISEWVGKTNQGEWKEAYLDTLEPSERQRQRKEQKAAKSQYGAELAKLIRIDDTFWAGKEQRENVKKRVRNTFQLSSGAQPTFSITIQSQAVPFVSRSGDTVTAFFDASFFYQDESAGTMQYMVEGRLEVSARDSEAADSPSAWRLVALHMDAGRSPPMSTMQRQAPPPVVDKNGLVPR